MKKFKVGGLELDEKEQRMYLIIIEAIKECPAHKRLADLEREMHGVDGNNGLKSKVSWLKGAFYVLSSLVVGIILYIATINILF
jgi:hypothetical protein